MKLLRLKITDPAGFRSLPCGFEHHFRTERSLQDELAKPDDFAPFVCAGPNGSGKSNLLEVLAAIFFQLDCKNILFRPDSFEYDEKTNPQGYSEEFGRPDAYELEYLICAPDSYIPHKKGALAHIKVVKEPGVGPQFFHINLNEFDVAPEIMGRIAKDFLPDFILGYSSGENETLSLPFFKMRFVQFDEYWQKLAQQLPYSGRPESRLAYLDNSFSQAILLCNLLFQDEMELQAFQNDVGVKELKQFRIILRRSIPLQLEQLDDFASEDEHDRQSVEDILKSNPALRTEIDPMGVTHYRLNLLHLIEGDERSSRMVNALKRCATLTYEDDETDTLILDYWVNDETKKVFAANFTNALELFQAFQVLLNLNLYPVSDALKKDLYQSKSPYVNETVPVLASDQRIMRFKFVRFTKQGVNEPVMLKDLSDGEHQLLHSLGLCLLFRNANSLFLLDEPETHFNPDWRANFISRLGKCFSPKKDEDKNSDTNTFNQEMLITTHTPFLISDSKPEKVLVFAKDETSGVVSISHPDYNTLGASINKITMKTFGKRETVGGHAQAILDGLRKRFEQGAEDKDSLIAEIHQQLGDSVEKVLLIKAILGGDQKGGEAQS